MIGLSGLWMSLVASTLSALLLVSCLEPPDDDESGAPVPALTYAIGGTVSGLKGVLVIELNNAERLPVDSQGNEQSFQFRHRLPNSAAYRLVFRLPQYHQCVLVQGDVSGVIDSADVELSIGCSRYYPVGGYVTGLNNSGLKLFSNTTVEQIEVLGNVFEFPTALLDGRVYQVSLAQQPQQQLCQLDNASGTVVGQTVSDIAVHCHAWAQPQTLDLVAGGYAYDPNLALDAAGNAMAVWYQYDGSGFSLFASRYEAADGQWSAAVAIESRIEGVEDPSLAFDHLGNAVVVWEQSDGNQKSIYANRYSLASAGWGQPQLLEFGSAAVADPRVALDASGNAIALWRQRDGSSYSLYASRYSSVTDDWGMPQLIEDLSASVSKAQLAVDAAGNALAVWQQSGTSTDIYANRYSVASDHWGLAVPIDNARGRADVPQVAIDPFGDAWAVWQQYDGNNRYSIFGNRYDAASDRWLGAQLIEDIDSGHAYEPQLDLDGSGNAQVVWRQSVAAKYRIYSRRYQAGAGDWGVIASLEDSQADDAYNPSIALSDDGNAIVVWKQDDGTANRIYANRYSVLDDRWSTAELVDVELGNHSYQPTIVINQNAEAVAIWYHNDGNRNRILVNHFH